MRSHEDLNRLSSQIFIICYSKLYFRIVGFSVSVTPMSSNEPCLKGFLLVKISSLFPSQYQLLPVVCTTRFPLLKVFCLGWASSQQSRVRKIARHSFSSVWSGDYSLYGRGKRRGGGSFHFFFFPLPFLSLLFQHKALQTSRRIRVKPLLPLYSSFSTSVFLCDLSSCFFKQFRAGDCDTQHPSCFCVSQN